ncbi:MAG: hypothetical protein ACE5H2_03290 [Terriglobia bacterium]
MACNEAFSAGALGVLLAVSLASCARVRTLGEQKYFCAVDCHLAYSVSDVRAATTLGTAPKQKTASGTFYVVSVKVWFEERTISAQRGNAPLRPNQRRIAVVDDAGRKYGIFLAGQTALEQAEGRDASVMKTVSFTSGSASGSNPSRNRAHVDHSEGGA